MTDKILANDADRGRMINRLRSYRSGSYYNWSERKWKPGRRIWTDEQIMHAMGLSKERFDRCVTANLNTAPRVLTYSTWRKRYFDFWDENERWHTTTDERKWKQTGLHSNRNSYIGGQARGVWVDEYCSKRMRLLRRKPEMVFGIPNLTTRRNVIDSLGGAEKLVQQIIDAGKASKVNTDKYGTLWKLAFPEGRDAHMMYVEVVNSSPQLDKNGKVIKRGGKPVYDHYFLRVPPDTTSAKAGVAWTFSKDPVGFKFAAQS